MKKARTRKKKTIRIKGVWDIAPPTSFVAGEGKTSERPTINFVNVANEEKVNHPSHYGGDVPHEVVKCLDAWGLEKDALLWNTVKYIARAGKKTSSPLQDLEKALWYLQRRISVLKATNLVFHKPFFELSTDPDRLSPDARKRVQDALKKEADAVIKKTKRMVPVDTGLLRKRCHVARPKQRSPRRRTQRGRTR